MKLLLCNLCHDIYPIGFKKRSCTCGQSWGAYLRDGWHARFSGKSVTPLGFANDSFEQALHNRPAGGNKGIEFTAFVIQRDCPTFEEVPWPVKSKPAG